MAETTEKIFDTQWPPPAGNGEVLSFSKEEHPDEGYVLYIQREADDLDTTVLQDHIKQALDQLRNIVPDLLPQGNMIPVLIVKKDDFLNKCDWPYREGNGGMCARNFNGNPPFTAALIVSDGIVDKLPEQYTRKAEEENFIHEIAHVLHSPYYTVHKNNAVLSEGLAELIPEYILGFEKDENFINKSKWLNPDRFTVESLDKNGFSYNLTNSEEQRILQELPANMDKKEKSRHYTQDSPTYLSAYLFMRGLIRGIEENENCEPQQALKTMLTYLQEVNGKPIQEQLNYFGEKIFKPTGKTYNLYTEFALQEEARKALQKDATGKEPIKIYAAAPQKEKGTSHG